MIGNPDQEMLQAVLETIPVEFSVVDKDDNVVAWNRHDTRIFKRAHGVLGKNVRNCHPKRSLEKVEAILTEMKSGSRDRAGFWIDLKIEGHEAPQKILIQYFALRSPEGAYLGCLECSQNVSPIQALKGQKRLLD